MNILITGITGMIGTHLAELAMASGYTVSGISRATSASRWQTQKTLYRHYTGDILDTSFLSRVCIFLQWVQADVLGLEAKLSFSASG